MFALALSSPGIIHHGRLISIICVNEPLLPSKTQPSELRQEGLICHVTEKSSGTEFGTPDGGYVFAGT